MFVQRIQEKRRKWVPCTIECPHRGHGAAPLQFGTLQVIVSKHCSEMKNLRRKQ